MSPSSELHIGVDTPIPARNTKGSPLNEIEREHILRILHETNGVVGGKHGTASTLGVKRTTLESKMKKLDISR